jgi:hypothetical protein
MLTLADDGFALDAVVILRVRSAQLTDATLPSNPMAGPLSTPFFTLLASRVVVTAATPLHVGSVEVASTVIVPAVTLPVMRTLPAKPVLTDAPEIGVVVPASTVKVDGAEMAGLLAADAIAKSGASRQTMSAIAATPDRRLSRRTSNQGA